MRTRHRTRAFTLLVVTCAMAWVAHPLLAVAQPAAQAVSTGLDWVATDAAVSSVDAAGPGGTSADQLTVRGTAPAMVAVSSLIPVAGGQDGVRVWIREVGAEGAFAQAEVVDAAGGVSSSAPIRLGALWQTFGVTHRTSATGGPLVIRLQPAAGAVWPAGTTVQVASLQVAPVAPSVVRRVAGTRDVTVNGNVFTGKGLSYNPTIIGEHRPPSSWADPATCQADAQLLGGAGVNLLRTEYQDESAALTSNYTQCLDAFWARGIGVAWLVDPPGNLEVVEPGPEYVATYQQRLQLAMQTFGSHPSTYLWIVGNELDRERNGPQCFFDNVGGRCAVAPGNDLQTLATYVHANDANHLVGTTVCCSFSATTCGTTASGILNPNQAPAIDFWGVNQYPENTFGTLLSCLAQDDPGRPVLMTEFGNDRYHCVPGLISATDNGHTFALSCKVGQGYEDQATQSSDDVSLFRNLLSQTATAASPNGAVFGGLVFMYSDLWWYTLSVLLDAGTPATHETLAVSPWGDPGDGTVSVEWFGVTYAQPPGQGGDPRITTAAFTQLGALFTGVAFPTISNPAVSNVQACSAVVSWTTATPSTTRADWGNLVQVVRNSGAMEDDTVYPFHVTNATLTTQHSIVVKTLTPATTISVVARGFDAAWHSDSSVPVVFTTPAGAGGC